VGKILDEERFHEAHGAAWFRRLAGAGHRAQAALAAAVDELLPPLLRWFGPDSERADALAAGRVTSAAGSELRARYMDRVAPLLDALGTMPDTAADAGAFDGFDEAARRTAGAPGPDEETLVKVRGDRNRAFLMD
jgi:1,2-phenylacetyl-CoA epoxidase catalytic subunit